MRYADATRGMFVTVISRKLIRKRIFRCKSIYGIVHLVVLINSVSYSVWSAVVADHYSVCFLYVNYVVNLGAYLVVYVSEYLHLQVLPAWRKPASCRQPVGIARFFPWWYVALVLLNCSVSMAAAISSFACGGSQLEVATATAAANQSASVVHAYAFVSELFSLVYLNFVWKLYPLDALQTVRTLYKQFSSRLSFATRDDHEFRRLMHLYREEYYRITQSFQPELLLHLLCAFISALTSLAMMVMWTDLGYAQLIDLICVPMDVLTSTLVVFILCHYPSKLEELHKICKRNYMRGSTLPETDKCLYLQLLVDLRLRPFKMTLFGTITLNRRFAISYVYAILGFLFVVRFLPQDTLDENDGKVSKQPACAYIDWFIYLVKI